MTATAEISREDATDTMSQLPEGWRWMKLDEVCKTKTGIRDPRRDPEKSFRYVDITSVDNKAKRIGETKNLFGKDAPSRARQVIHAGDVIVSTTRPNLNAVAFISSELDEQICSTGFCVLRAKPDLDSDYLFAFVQTTDFVEALSELVKGALYPAVSDYQVRQQIIPLPPLAEQKRIAGILQEQMAAVERARYSAEEQLQAVENLPAAHLRAVFESDEAQLWERKTLGELCKIAQGEALGLPELKPSGFPVYGANGRIGYYTRYHYEEPQVLVSCRGAKCATINVSEPKSYVTNNSMAMLPKNADQLDREYLRWVLDGGVAKAAISGSAQPQITGASLSPIEIFVPPIAAQRRIAAQLSSQMSSAERLRQTLTEQLDAINQLPAALLRRAFNGEL